MYRAISENLDTLLLNIESIAPVIDSYLADLENDAKHYAEQINARSYTHDEIGPTALERMITKIELRGIIDHSDLTILASKEKIRLIIGNVLVMINAAELIYLLTTQLYPSEISSPQAPAQTKISEIKSSFHSKLQRCKYIDII